MIISSLHFVVLLERESQRTIDVDEDDTDDDVVAAAVIKGQLLLKRKILRIMLYRMRNPLRHLLLLITILVDYYSSISYIVFVAHSCLS